MSVAALHVMKKINQPKSDKVVFTVHSLRELDHVRLSEVTGGGSPPVKFAFAPPAK